MNHTKELLRSLMGNAEKMSRSSGLKVPKRLRESKVR